MPHDERTMATQLRATAACWGAIAVLCMGSEIYKFNIFTEIMA